MKGTCVEGTIPRLFEGKMLVSIDSYSVCSFKMIGKIIPYNTVSEQEYNICKLVKSAQE